jgi:hypothetical protein
MKLIKLIFVLSLLSILVGEIQYFTLKPEGIDCPDKYCEKVESENMCYCAKLRCLSDKKKGLSPEECIKSKGVVTVADGCCYGSTDIITNDERQKILAALKEIIEKNLGSPPEDLPPPPTADPSETVGINQKIKINSEFTSEPTVGHLPDTSDPDGDPLDRTDVNIPQSSTSTDDDGPPAPDYIPESPRKSKKIFGFKIPMKADKSPPPPSYIPEPPSINWAVPDISEADGSKDSSKSRNESKPRSKSKSVHYSESELQSNSKNSKHKKKTGNYSESISKDKSKVKTEKTKKIK